MRALGLAAGALLLWAAAARAAEYPDWSGQWTLQGPTSWDPSRPPGRGQRPPLTPAYEKVFEDSLADQAAGGPGNDEHIFCRPYGMPRMMGTPFPMEFVIVPRATYMLFENSMPRRVFTDSRPWPKELEPSFVGTSIGRWLDEDGDGRFDALEVETRGFKGPRSFEATGIPLASDNETVVRERFWRDQDRPDLLYDRITTVDHALTEPWTVVKRYHRGPERPWMDDDCTENNAHVRIGREAYFLSADGLLMPAKKGQPPPDLRYFEERR